MHTTPKGAARKRLRLHNDWRQILKRAWSIRLMVLAAVLSGAEVALPLLDGVVTIPRGAFAVVSAAVTAGALVARILAQKEVGNEQA